jgi:hypothetical protein
MNYLRMKLHFLFRWEYWPMPIVYSPIFPVWFFYAFRARSFFFFNAANPSIRNGGMAMESKKAIYDIIPSAYIPNTLLVKEGTSTIEIEQALEKIGIHFPMIAKPDIGMKALGVDKIIDAEELKMYSDKISSDFILQELITFPQEIGIFYVRVPGENYGKITGLVAKEFLTVVGNGTNTLTQLIKQNPRSYFQLSSLKRKFGNYLNTILLPGEKFILVPYGSHTRGSKFIDLTSKLNEKLSQTINQICVQVPGFYFGRLDIRYDTFEDLCEGKNFSIIEINGAGSEPTHIYDPKHTLFFAWKEIIRHWKFLYQVSTINYAKGHSYLSFSKGREMLKENIQLEAKLKML